MYLYDESLQIPTPDRHGPANKKTARFCILFQASKWKKCRQAGQNFDFHYAFTNLPLPKRPDSLSQNFKFLICQIF
jgi:hypothetical protein